MKNIVSNYIWMACCCLIAMLIITPNIMASDSSAKSDAIAQVSMAEDENNDRLVNKTNISSVFVIGGDELIRSGENHLMGALQGRIPGMRILQTNDQPGQSGYSAQIRGRESTSAAPLLILVDGVERDISEINLPDVESVTVLRDGAATAIYGMRAASGAILVNTKRGFDGESIINVSFDQSFQSPTRLPEYVPAYDYANLYNQRQANDTLYADMQDIRAGGTGIDHSGVSFYTPFELDRYRMGDMQEFFPTRDMMGEFINDFSQMSRVNISFQGGSPAMKYFTSVGFQQQGTLFKSEPFDRYSYDSEGRANRFNFRTNLDINLNQTLNMWINVAGSIAAINSPFFGSGTNYSDFIAKLYETPNNAHQDLTPEGEVLVKRDKINYQQNSSVYGMLNRTGSSNLTRTRVGTNFGARQDLEIITPGLALSGQMSFDVFGRSTLNRSRDYQAFEVAVFPDINGLDSLGYAEVPGTSNTGLSDGQGRFFNYMYDMYLGLEYKRYFGQKHYVDALFRAENNIFQQEDLLNRYFMGLAGRLAYSYDNKYLAEASFTYQGSEQFAKGNRFGFFPSLALGWIVSNEDFLAANNALSFLKLRASLGQVGNTGITYGGTDQFLYLTRWNTNATENQIGNPDLTWETTTKFNVGFESGLFNSFYLTADYFYHKTVDIMILDIATVPTNMMGLGGASLPPANVGEAENMGFELFAGYNKQLSEDFSLNLSGNVSMSKNNRIYMAELAYDETYAYPFRQQGYPIGYFWGYKTDGLFNNQQEIDNWADQSALGGHPIPGDIKYLDLNNDGIVDEKDLAPLAMGNQPEVVYGFRAQAAYKWFDVTVFVNGMTNRNVYLSGFGRWGNRDNFTEYMKNAWTPELAASGEDVLYPRLGRSSTNHRISDYWITDGSFIRLRNLEVGFTFPEHLSRRINAGKIRLYATGLNLMVWDQLPNKDFDPETASGSNTGYPLTQSFIFGASVNF